MVEKESNGRNTRATLERTRVHIGGWVEPTSSGRLNRATQRKKVNARRRLDQDPTAQKDLRDRRSERFSERGPSDGNPTAQNGWRDRVVRTFTRTWTVRWKSDGSRGSRVQKGWNRCGDGWVQPGTRVGLGSDLSPTAKLTRV